MKAVRTSKSITIYSLALGVLIGLLAGYLLINSVMDASLCRKTGENQHLALLNAFKFYETEPVGEEVLIIGSSTVVQGIDANIAERDTGYEVYNLGVPGDLPLRRLTELPYILERKPKAVIIGVTGSYVRRENLINEDRLMLVRDKITYDPEVRQFFQATDQIPIYDWTWRDEMQAKFAYPRKFMKYIFDLDTVKIILSSRSDCDELDRGQVKRQPSQIMHLDPVRLTQRPHAGYYTDFNVVPKDNFQKKALRHMIGELKENGIQVIVVHMPISPALSSVILPDARLELGNVIRRMEVPYASYEQEYKNTHFYDYVHLNDIGTHDFSLEINELIKRGVE